MNKPLPDEYAQFYSGYINMVGDAPILAQLEELKNSSYNFFAGLTDEQGDYAYAEGKWTIKELLGHMIDAERTFAYRILAFSRGQEELPGFDENIYVEKANFNTRLLKDLATEFRQVRAGNMYLFNSLSPQQIAATGIASGKTV